MFGDVGVHRVDEGDVVDALRDLRENIADPLAAFTVLFETEGRGHQSHLGVAERFTIDAVRTFAGMFCDHRLIVKGVDL